MSASMYHERQINPGVASREIIRVGRERYVADVLAVIYFKMCLFWLFRGIYHFS